MCGGTVAKSKYHSRKTVWNGITYDSAKEARRHAELLLLEKAGVIQSLQRQVEYVLIPRQKINGRIVERTCTYIADFVYTQTGNMETVVEDVKGYRTPEYIIKRKLMLYIHGIRIHEV